RRGRFWSASWRSRRALTRTRRRSCSTRSWQPRPEPLPTQRRSHAARPAAGMSDVYVVTFVLAAGRVRVDAPATATALLRRLPATGGGWAVPCDVPLPLPGALADVPVRDRVTDWAAAVGPDADVVLVHDTALPLPSAESIGVVLAQVMATGRSVVPVLPC